MPGGSRLAGADGIEQLQANGDQHDRDHHAPDNHLGQRARQPCPERRLSYLEALLDATTFPQFPKEGTQQGTPAGKK